MKSKDEAGICLFLWYALNGSCIRKYLTSRGPRSLFLIHMVKHALGGSGVDMS